MSMKKRLLGCATVALGAGLLYSYVNANTVVRTDYILTTDKLDTNYKILYISDVHFGHKQNREVLRNSVETMKRIEPDIVIIGGDIAMEGVSYQDMVEAFQLLSSIPAKYGTFYVHGNHDIPNFDDTYYYTERELISTIEDCGITILNDSTVTVNGDIMLTGRYPTQRNEDHLWDVKHCVNVSKIPTHYSIVVDHAPVDVKVNAAYGVDLQLSGHTHAGQLFPINLGLKMFNIPSYGHQRVNDMDLIVSSGFGVGRFTLRNVKHCEYVVVDIYGTKGGN